MKDLMRREYQWDIMVGMVWGGASVHYFGSEIVWAFIAAHFMIVVFNWNRAQIRKRDE